MTYFEQLTEYQIMNQFVQQADYQAISKVWNATGGKVRIQTEDIVGAKVREQVWKEIQCHTSSD
jgi:hypothetical protein